MGNRTSISSLPSDIITEILLFLPLESVFSCKLVSKKWKNLLEDSNFIKLYKADSTAFFLDKGVLKCFIHNKDEKSYESRRIPKKIVSREDDNSLELLLESSNKIACVKTRDGKFMLYNLFTRDLRIVADAPAHSHKSFIGFGSDRYENDYKIIVICNERDKKRNLIFIYSYKKGYWDNREGFENDEYKWTAILGGRGFTINGVLHWIVTKSNNRRRIIGLDLNTYGLVEFKILPVYMSAYANLTTFNEKLCCFVDAFHLDVWVMEEYGVENSWTKLLTVGRSRIDTRFNWYDVKDMRIYQDKDGEIIVFIHNQMQYNLFKFDARSDENQAYIMNCGSKADKKIQVELKSLKTRFKNAFCLQPHT